MFLKSISQVSLGSLLVLAAFALYFLSLSATHAQVQDDNFPEVSANINLTDVAVTAESQDFITLEFQMNNETTSAYTGVTYEVRVLVATYEGASGTVYDTSLVEGVASLPANESTTVVLDYPVSNVPSGKYILQITAKNSAGETIGFGQISDVDISSSLQIELLLDTCTAAYNSENYGLFTPVQINSIDNPLTINCQVRNTSSNNVTLWPQFQSRLATETLYADQSVTESNSFSIAPNQTAVGTFVVPLASVAGTYEVLLSVVDDRNPLLTSNSVTASYILADAGAMITSVSLDKNNYSAGETMVATVNWVDASNNFGSEDALESAASLRVVSSCIDEVVVPLSASETTLTVSLTANNDCAYPELIFELLSDEGEILFAYDYISGDVEVTESSNSFMSFFTKNTTILVLALIGLIAVIALVIRRGYRTQHTYSFFFIALVFSGLMMGAQSVEAVSFSNQFSFGNFDADRSTYAPGENINIVYSFDDRHGSYFMERMTYPRYGVDARLSFQGDTITIYNRSINNFPRTGLPISGPSWMFGYSRGALSFTAPSIPGVYNVNLQVCGERRLYSIRTRRNDPRRTDCYNYSLSITVAAPTPATVTGFSLRSNNPNQNHTSNATIAHNSSLNQITWSSKNATTCQGSGFATNGQAAGTITNAANITQPPEGGNRLYRVRCRNGSGPWTNWQDIRITKQAAPVLPVVSAVSVTLSNGQTVNTDTNIAHDQTVSRINWSSRNATTCEGSANYRLVGGATSGNSTVGIVQPTSATAQTYRVRCRNVTNAWSAWQNVTIRKSAAPTASMSLLTSNRANPVTATASGNNITIPHGATVSRITWSSQNATVCRSEGFSVNGATSGNITSGLPQPAANSSRTYRVRCQNSAGTWSPWQSVVVTRSAAVLPTVTALTVTSNNPVTGTNTNHNSSAAIGHSDTVTRVSWNSNNATSCTGVGFNTGGATSGNANVGITQPPVNGSTPYRVVCRSASAQEAQREVVLRRDALPPIDLEVRVDRPIVRRGDSAQVSVTISAPYAVSCTINNVAGGGTISHAGGSDTNVTRNTNIVNNMLAIRVACTSSAAGVAPVNETVYVNIVPEISEQ